ncbi:hypothetical protein HK405_015203, partial [Cladochytrium tenue]
AFSVGKGYEAQTGGMGAGIESGVVIGTAVLIMAAKNGSIKIDFATGVSAATGAAEAEKKEEVAMLAGRGHQQYEEQDHQHCRRDPDLPSHPSMATLGNPHQRLLATGPATARSNGSGDDAGGDGGSSSGANSSARSTRFYGVASANEDSLYNLPTDVTEKNRLYLQHVVLRHIFGRIFHTPQRALFESADGGKILDVGCGSLA